MCFAVNKCCFCLNLNAGTRIIAVLSVVCSLSTAALYAGAAWSLPPVPLTRHSFYLLVAAVSLCHTLCSALLLYGAFWTKPRYLWPWLVLCWASGGALLLLSALGVVLLSLQYYQNEETAADMNSMSSVYFVSAAIMFYCAIVIRSRRIEMIRAQETDSADKLMRQRDARKDLLV